MGELRLYDDWRSSLLRGRNIPDFVTPGRRLQWKQQTDLAVNVCESGTYTSENGRIEGKKHTRR